MNTLTNSAADLITVVILSREWHQQYFEISALTGMSSESICDFSFFFFFGDMVIKQKVILLLLFFAYVHY